MPDGAAFDHLLRELAALRAVDPLPFLSAMATREDLTEPQHRHLRADTLRILLERAHRGAALSGLQDELVVRPEGVFIDIGGVLIDVLAAPMYLKASRKPQANQAARMDRVLAARGIDVRTVVDVGANVGEISFWFARKYPAARVVAVEPSGDTRAAFERNRSVQRFDASRVELVAEAVCAKRGTVHLSRGAGPMNRLVAGGSADKVEAVAGDRLDALFDRLGVAQADFVKIDIEGGEPALADALVALGPRVRACQIEFSKFAPQEHYVRLADALIGAGFACFDEAAERPLATGALVGRHMAEVLGPEHTSVTNLWFLRTA